MLCLFGYDLPETNHLYLLAHSINDMWRRINIYWKDFMVKIVYFPAYFKLRRKGALRAELLSTVLVVVATYVLHAYQFFWLKGQFRWSGERHAVLAILGTVMMVNVWIEYRNRQRPASTGWGRGLQNAVQVCATFAFIALLWSMWSADSLLNGSTSCAPETSDGLQPIRIEAAVIRMLDAFTRQFALTVALLLCLLGLNCFPPS